MVRKERKNHFSAFSAVNYANMNIYKIDTNESFSSLVTFETCTSLLNGIKNVFTCVYVFYNSATFFFLMTMFVSEE